MPDKEKAAAKPLLAPKQTTYYVLDDRAFDELVNTHLNPPRAYACVADEEWNNDECHAYEITPGDYGRDEQADMRKFCKSQQNYAGAAQILSELARRGVIPWGNYLIKVSW